MVEELETRLEHTMTDDNIFTFSDKPMWFYEAVVEIQDNDVVYGNFNNQSSRLSVNETMSISKRDISRIMFKNAIAGSNATIIVQGTLMTDKQKQEMGI
jgi:hypothetical protein